MGRTLPKGLPIIKWAGGKAKSARQILRHVLFADVGEYREPFVGSGTLFSSAWRWYEAVGRHPSYWLNDLHPALVALYTELRDNPNVARRMIEIRQRFVSAPLRRIWQEFDLCRFEYDRFGSPLALWFLTRFAKQQLVSRRRRDIAAFHFPYAQDGLEPLTPERILRARQQLQGVRVTCGDYRPLLESQGTDVLVVLDPPYYMSESAGMYEHDLVEQEQHVQLFDMLVECPHRFIMTYGWSRFGERQAKKRGFSYFYQQFHYSGAGRRALRPAAKEMVITNISGPGGWGKLWR